MYIKGRPALAKDLLVPCLRRVVDCLCLVVVLGLLNSDYIKLLAIVQHYRGKSISCYSILISYRQSYYQELGASSSYIVGKVKLKLSYILRVVKLILSQLSIQVISQLYTITLFITLKGGRLRLTSVELAYPKGIELAYNVYRVFLFLSSIS